MTKTHGSHATRHKEPMVKQSLYVRQALLEALESECVRLDRSMSWVVQRCVRIGMPDVRALPSDAVARRVTTEAEAEAAE